MLDIFIGSQRPHESVRNPCFRTILGSNQKPIYEQDNLLKAQKQDIA
jgi:hypothetical protein